MYPDFPDFFSRHSLTSTAFEHLAAETPGCGQLVQGRHARKQGLNGQGSNSRLGDRKLNAVTITQSRLMHANSTADRERQFDVSVDRSDFTSVHTIPTDPLRTPSPTACLCFFGGGGGSDFSPTVWVEPSFLRRRCRSHP